MTILEKITTAAEGIFYKCYNKDAMLFHKQVTPYRCTVRRYKIVGSEVMLLGFPMSLIKQDDLTLEKIAECLSAVRWEESEGQVQFVLPEPSTVDYRPFMQSIITDTNTSTEPASADSIIQKIHQFDLANRTPMQALAFVQELKEDLQLMEVSVGSFLNTSLSTTQSLPAGSPK